MNFKPQKFRLVPFPKEYAPDSVYQFTETLRELARTSRDPILVDCQHIQMIYSGGLGILINGYKFCNEHKIFFGLVHINDIIRTIIYSTNLNKVINVFSTTLEFEILDNEEKNIGTKIPPFDFHYQEKKISGINLYICHGIMFLDPTVDQLAQSLSHLDKAIFDFGQLTYVDIDCIQIFKEFSKRSKMYVLHLSDFMAEEFKLHDLYDQLLLRDSLNTILAENLQA